MSRDTLLTARFGDWMQTHSGGRFYPLDPRPDDLVADDIAHALSLLCRYGGHDWFADALLGLAAVAGAGALLLGFVAGARR